MFEIRWSDATPLAKVRVGLLLASLGLGLGSFALLRAERAWGGEGLLIAGLALGVLAQLCGAAFFFASARLARSTAARIAFTACGLGLLALLALARRAR